MRAFMFLAAAMLAVMTTVGCRQVAPSQPQLTVPEAAPAPASSQGSPDEVALAFAGRVTGSDVIQINMQAATWTNLHWGILDAPIDFCGIAWNPGLDSTLPNAGPSRFLSRPVRFDAARLERIRGRDLVAIERRPESLLVHICDTPNGDDLYEFKIFLPIGRPGAAPPPTAARVAKLSVSGDMDGSQELWIYQDRAVWKVRHWGWPGAVKLNGVGWTPSPEAPELANHGETAFLRTHVDFSRAAVTSVSGRDTAVVEPHRDHVVVYFADNPVGGDHYDIDIDLPMQ